MTVSFHSIAYWEKKKLLACLQRGSGISDKGLPAYLVPFLASPGHHGSSVGKKKSLFSFCIWIYWGFFVSLEYHLVKELIKN